MIVFQSNFHLDIAVIKISCKIRLNSDKDNDLECYQNLLTGIEFARFLKSSEFFLPFPRINTDPLSTSLYFTQLIMA